MKKEQEELQRVAQTAKTSKDTSIGVTNESYCNSSPV